MNYIIDCGYSTGVFTLRYLRALAYQGEDLSNWTIYGFEPNEVWRDRAVRATSEFPDATFHLSPAAVWTTDGTMRFFPCIGPVSSYLADAYHRQLESGRKASIQVPTMDLSRIIFELAAPEKIILKVDIEGAEFYVLPHIQKTGAASRLTHVYIEYHARLNRKDWLPIMIELKEWWAAHPEIEVRPWR